MICYLNPYSGQLLILFIINSCSILLIVYKFLTQINEFSELHSDLYIYILDLCGGTLVTSRMPLAISVDGTYWDVSFMGPDCFIVHIVFFRIF